MIGVKVVRTHMDGNTVDYLCSPSCECVPHVLAALAPGSLLLQQVRVFGFCLHTSFIEVISATDYILCGFDSGAQMCSVFFFLEESEQEQIRRNMLVS